MKANLLLLLLICIFFSCQKENIIVEQKQTGNPQIINITEEMREKAGDIVYDESNMDQLFLHMDSVLEKELANKGYRKAIEKPNIIQSKVHVENRSYVSHYTDIYHMVESEKWVKINFYNELADEVNRQWSGVDNNQVERGKTYFCTWRYYEAVAKLADNEYFGAKKSRLCGLKPSSRYQLRQCLRDYESYESPSDPNTTLMLTYILQIVCRDVNGPTQLHENFYYPAPGSGYVFEYSVLVM